MIVYLRIGDEVMEKEYKQNILSVLVIGIVHTALCVLYNFTFYNEELMFPGRFTGFPYYALLMAYFLFAPLCYYIAGRAFHNKASKKFYLGMTWSVFGVFGLFGAVSMFIPSVASFYRCINAPSFMYYQLFSDSVFYISVPAMLVSAVFPALFSRMGFLKKERQNNEIKKDDSKAQEPQK